MEYIIEIYEGEPWNPHYAGYAFVTAKSDEEAQRQAKIIEARPNVSFVKVYPYQSADAGFD